MSRPWWKDVIRDLRDACDDNCYVEFQRGGNGWHDQFFVYMDEDCSIYDDDYYDNFSSVCDDWDMWIEDTDDDFMLIVSND